MKKMIFQNEAVIAPGDVGKVVHHYVVYGCNYDPADVDAFYQFMEDYPKGVDCYGSDADFNIFSSCGQVLVAWATGGKGFILPENVGFPIPSTSESELPMFYRMEMHYDNPEHHVGLIDTSGLRMYVTEDLREVESGPLIVQTSVWYSEMIPPKQDNFVAVGHCHSLCTEASFPEDGIYVFGGMLHAHLLGRKIVVRHWRNGEELEHLAADNAYDFNFQQTRMYDPPIHVLPGDSLTVECFLSSAHTNVTTFGGLQTTDEMCQAFLQYYPFTETISSCHSSIWESQLNRWIGLAPGLYVYAEQSTFTYWVSTDPPMTLSDWLDGDGSDFNWDNVDMEAFQEFMRYENHIGGCTSVNDESVLDVVARYPDAPDWVPPARDCPARKN